jgi:hypothetical protein
MEFARYEPAPKLVSDELKKAYELARRNK